MAGKDDAEIMEAAVPLCKGEDCKFQRYHKRYKGKAPKSVMDKLSGFIRKNWFWVTAVLVAVAVFGKIFESDYSFHEQKIQSISDTTIVKRTVLVVEPEKKWLGLLFDCCMTLGLGIFVSAYIVKAIEKDSQQEFEERIRSFQKEAAQNAILAVYNNLIPNEFTNTIKRDIFEKGLFRRNAYWDFTFEKCESDKILLTRVVSYDLYNTMNVDQSDTITTTFNRTPFVKTWVEKITVRHREKIDTVYERSRDDEYTNNKSITLEPGEFKNVSFVLKQLFSFDKHVHETHFSKHPIIDLRITVNYPEEYEFQVGAVGFTTPMQESGMLVCKKIYEINGAIYTGQGFEFCLMKSGVSPSIPAPLEA